jgi:hypothetical protein
MAAKARSPVKDSSRAEEALLVASVEPGTADAIDAVALVAKRWSFSREIQKDVRLVASRPCLV